MEEVPCHERRVAVREVVGGTAAARVEVRGSGASLADPSCVGLRRDRVTEVLQGVQDVHGAVLDAVLVAGDEAAADAPVIGVLPELVQQMRVAVQPLDHLGADRRLLAQPDGAAQDEDVGFLHALEELRPVITLVAMFAHVGVDADRDLVVDGAHEVDRHVVPAHDLHRDPRQPFGVGQLG